MNPARVRSAVVLPQPEGPRSVKNSPCVQSRFSSGMAVKPPKVTSMFSKRIMDLSSAGSGNQGWQRGPGRGRSGRRPAGSAHVFEFDLLDPGAHVLLDEAPVDVLLLERSKKSTTSGLACAPPPSLTGMALNSWANSPCVSALPNQSMNFNASSFFFVPFTRATCSMA